MEDGLTYFLEVDEASQNEITIIITCSICPDSKVLEGFEMKGGIERDGVLFVIKDEKAKEEDAKVKEWLQKFDLIKQAP